MPIFAKPISALEKCFMDESYESKAQLDRGSALRGEEYAFEIAYTTDDATFYPKREFIVKVDSPIADYVTVRTVEQVPVRMACYPDADDNYLRKTPGFYPDLLRPVNSGNTAYFTYGELKALYVTVDVPEALAGGDYPIRISFTSFEGEEAASVTHTLHVIDAVIPEQKLKVTEWFHTDCIANYYGLEAFSDKHFEYIEKFMKCAVKNGINMILMPVFTPPLDTAIGGERLTTQLVGVRETESGWEFDFTLLERWVEIAKRSGVKYHEIAHFYSQWGAAFAPKIVGYDKNGEWKKLFGWDTPALSDEYRGFLNAFVPALLAKFEKLGLDKDSVVFHISDEPALEHLENYSKARAQVETLLDGYVIMDALSDFEFYKTGALSHPIPSNDHIVPFLEAGVENLWTYYCCGQGKDVSNRFVAMPTARTRIMGAQMWKYNIAGFLQWGFNFYSTQNSVDPIDPFAYADNDYFVPAGDTFAVLPGLNGEPWETLHMKGFTMALQDMRAMDLAAELTSREEVLAIIDPDGEMTFAKYPQSMEWIEDMRAKLDAIIEANI